MGVVSDSQEELEFGQVDSSLTCRIMGSFLESDGSCRRREDGGYLQGPGCSLAELKAPAPVATLQVLCFIFV